MSGDGGKINIQLIGPDNVTYKYFIEEADSPHSLFLFTAGSGSYTPYGLPEYFRRSVCLPFFSQGD